MHKINHWTGKHICNIWIVQMLDYIIYIGGSLTGDPRLIQGATDFIALKK